MLTRRVPSWYGRWVAWVTCGEVAGFAVPAVALAVVLDGGAGGRAADGAVTAVTAVAAGVVEGALLGAAQARVLRDVVGVRARPWVLATAGAAAVAWALGMLPTTTSAVWSGWPVAARLAAAGLLGAALLASLGTAQWWVLRRRLPGAGWWVAGTAAAWLAGLAAFALVTTPLWQPGQGLATVVAVGVLGGAAMAVTMAAATGLVLAALVRRAGGSGRSRAVSAPLASVGP